MTRALATLPPGLETIAAEELANLGAGNLEPRAYGRGTVAFTVQAPEAMAGILAGGRTLHRAGLVLATGHVPDEDPATALANLTAEAQLSPWIDDQVSFAARCTRMGDQAYTSQAVETELGSLIWQAVVDAHGADPSVDLDAPDIVLRLRLEADGQATLWTDLVGYRSLHRRGYRRVHHHASMKASLAAGILRLVGWDGQGLLVDPMAGSGTLGIEALWMAHGIPTTHLRRNGLTLWNAPRLRQADPDGLMPLPALPDEVPGQHGPEVIIGDIHPPHVDAMATNAKAAGVRSRLATFQAPIHQLTDHVETCTWLVANPPYGLRSSSPKEVQRVYQRCFDQASQLLTDDGTLGLMTPLDELVDTCARDHGFTLDQRIPVQHGGLDISLNVLSP